MDDPNIHAYPPAPEPASPETGMPMYDKTIAQLNTVGSVEVSAVPHRPTVTEMLLQKRNYLAAELAAVDKALAEAKGNPGAMNLIDAISKTRVKMEY